MNKYSLTIFVALLLALSACTPTATVGPDAPIGLSPTAEVRDTPTPLTTPMPTPEPSLEPEAIPTIWGEQTLQTTFMDEKGNVYFNMAFSFPYAAAPGYDAVNVYFSELLQAYADEARGYAEEIKASGLYPTSYGGDLYLYANTRSICTSDRFMTFTFSRNCWLGGPHPYYEIFYANLDLTTGKALTLPGLFTDWPAARERILAEIKGQLPAQYLDHLDGNPSPIEVDYDEMGERADQYLDYAPFCLTDDGVEFCFNKGKVASSYDTPYYFTVAYESLSDLWALGEIPTFTEEAGYEELVPPSSETPSIWGEQAMRTNYYTEDGTWLYELDISYPLVGSMGAGYDAINSYYAEQLQATLTDPAFCPAAAQEEFKYYQENYDGKVSPRLPFYLLTDHTVRYQSERLISIEIYREGYSGGAHPFHQSSSDCFDLNTGERLALSDLFSDWPAARKRILGEIQSQLKERMPEARYGYAAQSADEALDATPFFLSQNGLVILYNEYAIASYVEGSFEFLIPYETLEDILIT